MKHTLKKSPLYLLALASAFAFTACNESESSSGVATATGSVAAGPTYDFPAGSFKNLQQRFIDKDVDKDGYLNVEEFTAYLAVWLAEKEPQTDPIAKGKERFPVKDANGDGLISPQEIF